MASTRLISTITQHPKHSSPHTTSKRHTGMAPSSSSANGNGQDERLLSRHPREVTQNNQNYGSMRVGGGHAPQASDGGGVSFEDEAREVGSVHHSRSGSSSSSITTATSSSSSSTIGTTKLADVTYKSMMLLYWLVPLTIGFVFYSLVLLGKYAWPPTARERSLPFPPSYPHPFLFQPFTIGILGSIAAQAVRRPIYAGLGIAVDAVSSRSTGKAAGTTPSRHAVGMGRTLPIFIITSILATTTHTTLHELLRLLTLPLLTPTPSIPFMIPTTTQLFQQSYHLGLGWGLAEAVWGTVKGWFAGMRLYVDVLPVDRSAATKAAGLSGEQKIRVAQGQSRGDEEERVYDGQDVEHRTQDDSAVIDIEQEDDDDDNVSDVSAEEEEDLATKIAILERLRGRRELEQILGIPFPNIALPLHLLWRIDALLFNLGLTLIVSAYWYDIEPIYTRHSHRSSPLPPPSNGSGGGGNGYPPFPPVGSQRHHRLFPLIMFGVIAVHVVVSLVWSLGVRKAGIGAVTWGSLIISLGAVFAGLGAWGALV